MLHKAKVNNLTDVKDLRQGLRTTATPAEIALWQFLKKSQVGGLKFRRQHSVGEFVLDFYCPEIRLGIELDGGVHKTSYTHEYDEMRTRFMAENGIRVMRFDDEVVYNNIEGIIEAIKNACSDHP